jgi:hypothetical protein
MRERLVEQVPMDSLPYHEGMGSAEVDEWKQHLYMLPLLMPAGVGAVASVGISSGIDLSEPANQEHVGRVLGLKPETVRRYQRTARKCLECVRTWDGQFWTELLARKSEIRKRLDTPCYLTFLLERVYDLCRHPGRLGGNAREYLVLSRALEDHYGSALTILQILHSTELSESEDAVLWSEVAAIAEGGLVEGADNQIAIGTLMEWLIGDRSERPSLDAPRSVHEALICALRARGLEFDLIVP